MTLHYPALVHVLCRARGRVRSSQKATLGAQRLLMVGLALTLLLASTRALSSSTLYSNARSILEHFKGSAQQDDARLGVRRVQVRRRLLQIAASQTAYSSVVGRF